MVDLVGRILKRGLSPITQILVHLKIAPNFVTITGFIISLVAAFLYARGYFFMGGIVLVISGLFDMIDGELSRRLNRVTRFGAFLDSTLDRISECFIFLGLGIFLGRLNWQYTILVILALSGSLLVSYTRARAEGLGITGKVGFFERGTRFFILFIGSILGVKIMVYLLILLVLGTVSTIIQRIIFAYQRC